MFQMTRQGAVKIIAGDLPLSADHAAGVHKICEQALMDGQPRLVFQLQNVPLIDSAGLELLLDVRDRCMQRGGALHLAAPNPLCRDILAATQVAKEFTIFDDALSAVGSFSQ